VGEDERVDLVIALLTGFAAFVVAVLLLGTLGMIGPVEAVLCAVVACGVGGLVLRARRSRNTGPAPRS